MVIFNLVMLISSILIVGKYSDGEAVNGDIVITMIGMIISQILFLGIGSAIAAVKKKSKTAGSLATGILLLKFILSVAIDLNEPIEGLKYLTPFKYFEPKNVMYGGGLDWVFILLSNVFFKKRDLTV